MIVFDDCVNCMRGSRREEEEMGDTIDMRADNKPPQKTAGYLEKRGKLKFMNSWKKYWFVLEGHLLLYYGSKDDYDGLSPCKGSISLGHTSTVKPYSPVPLGFQITIRSTTITLRAETAAEQTKWMQAFVTALNPNQNTNESPTKLNHFRYSAENLSMLVENKEDFQGTPNSSPQGISPQHTPKSKEAPLIDRLQKLGARSYSSNSSVQNQILESVRNSRQRSFVKEMVAEHNRKEDWDEKENNQEYRDFLLKKEDVILEDEDFCVCTLGKEDLDNDDSRTTRKGLKNESDTSFSVILRQELNSEFIRRRQSNESKKSGSSQIDDATVDDQLNSAEVIDRSVNKNKHIMKKSLNEETEVQLNEKMEMIKHHEPPHLPNNPPLYENVDIKQEFYLHRDSNQEPGMKTRETTKVIQVKPVRKMKNNIHHLFLDSKDNSSNNRTVDADEKRISKDEVHTDPIELNRTHLKEENAIDNM
ncbi:hypothetical protein WA026_000082 [Henosepilachna vigintioctopunctata]|uniref:PH domain-containing protein n=1 Tax=Henosepilachna vigintioctopunctata TaxID=420089 RepID=A0AAW1V4W1_9CUCU